MLDLSNRETLQTRLSQEGKTIFLSFLRGTGEFETSYTCLFRLIVVKNLMLIPPYLSI